MPFYTNQLGLGKRHWNLETSSAVVEFPPPYRFCKSVMTNIAMQPLAPDGVMLKIALNKISKVPWNLRSTITDLYANIIFVFASGSNYLIFQHLKHQN